MSEEESPDDPYVSGQSAQLTEDEAHAIRRRNEIILNNFPLTVYPYNDSAFLEELATFIVKEEADFKRVLHAHLLSHGDENGWVMDLLKAEVKASMGFDDTKYVDRFVKKHYNYLNFEQFVKAAQDLAIVDENGRVFPYLDETTKPLYDDAIASTRNKDDKERKKDETIARNLMDPKSIEEFYRGVNRLRKAIIEAVKIHGTKDNAITKIHVMDGSGDIVDGINYNHVLTEYEKLFQRKLTDDSKKICGRSTLMKGLTKGQAPDCFIETIVMEVKSEGPERGAYIGVKKNSREYSEAEIQMEADKYGELRAQADNRLRKWDDRDSRPAYVPMERPGENEKAERQRRMRDQMEGQTARTANQPATHPNQSVPPSRSPNTTQSSEVLDEIARRIRAPGKNDIPFDERSKKTNKAIPRDDDSGQDESGKDSSDSNQDYSDDENFEAKRKKTAAKKKNLEKEKQRKRQEEGLLSDFVSPSSQPLSNRDEMIQIQETAPQHSPSLPPRSSIDHHHEAEIEMELGSIPVTNAPRRRGIGQSNTWDVPESSESPPPRPVDPPSPSHPSLQQQVTPEAVDVLPHAPVFAPQPIPEETYPQHQQGQPIQPHYNQQQMPLQQSSVPSPLMGQSVSPSPCPIGDTMQQVPMLDQYGQLVYPPHQQYPQYTGQPGVPPSPFPLQPNYGAHAPPQSPYPPPPPPQLPPSAPAYGSYPPYYPQEGGHYSPYYNTAPPPPPQFYPPPGGAYPPQHRYPSYAPYGVPPPGQNGHPGGYGYNAGGSQPPVVNVHVVHGAPPPPSDQFPSNYQTPSLSHQGYGSRDTRPSPSPPPSHYKGVPSDGVLPPPDPRYATPFTHRENNGYQQREQMEEYGGQRRGSLEEAARERRTRYETRPVQSNHPIHPTPHYSPRMDERRERRAERSPPPTQIMKTNEQERRGFEDDSSGVNERELRRRDGEMRRDDGRGVGQWNDDHNGRGDGTSGQPMRRQTGPAMDYGRERERPRRMEEPPQRDSTRQGDGRKEGEERGDGRRDSRANGRRDDERRADGLGEQPRGSTTPLYASREDEFSLRRSHFNMYSFESASERIRFQVVTILRNVRDKNLEKLTHGQELQFELLEIETLGGLIELGCGNEMEFYEATHGLNMSGDNLIFNLIKDMQNNGLCQAYKGKAKNRKTGELEDKVYVMDPIYQAPSSFNLTKLGE